MADASPASARAVDERKTAPRALGGTTPAPAERTTGNPNGSLAYHSPHPAVSRPAFPREGKRPSTPPLKLAADGNDDSFGRLDLLTTGLWFGLLAGFLEVAEGLVARKWAGVVTYDTLRTNHHYAWLTPASYLAMATVLALAMIAVSTVLRRPFRRSTALWAFAAGLGWSTALAVSGLHGLARLALAFGIASAVARAALARPRGFRRLVRASTPIGLAATALVAVSATAGGRSSAAIRPARDDAPNVVLIVLDTARADSLSPYGSDRDVTPNLAKLAERGVLFRHARSTASWTLPAHASLFTGRWPSELSVDVGRPLDATYPTLAEELAARGYATAGFVANTENCNAWYGLARGFERYEDFYENGQVTPLEVVRGSRLGRYLAATRPGMKLIAATAGRDRYRYRKSAEMIGRDALAWLDDRRDDRPFFLFLNYFDAHDPYVPPDGADQRYWNPETSGPEAARDGYDDCLAYLDDQLGRFLDELERRGETERTIFVVTSDHGEGFGEHGLSGHGLSLYRMETHIPLVVVAPAVPAGVAVERSASLRDVAATILELVDGAPADGPFPGSSLVAAWDDAVPDAPAPVLLELDRGRAVPDEAAEGAPARLGPMRSLVADRHAYIVNGDGGEELYDLDDDPEETRDLSGSPDAAARLERFRDLMRSME